MTIRKAVKHAKNQSNRLKTRKKNIRKTVKKTQPKSQNYDTDLNFKENMKNLGWMTDINKRVNKLTDKKEQNKEQNDLIDVEEEIDLSNLVNGQIVLEKKNKKLCKEDRSVIENLQKKYNNNFEKMFKDIKINKYQWNKNIIEKNYNTYLEIYGQFQ